MAGLFDLLKKSKWGSSKLTEGSSSGGRPKVCPSSKVGGTGDGSSSRRRELERASEGGSGVLYEEAERVRTISSEKGGGQEMIRTLVARVQIPKEKTKVQSRRGPFPTTPNTAGVSW